MLCSDIVRVTANQVFFDPANPEHRKIAATHIATHSWRHTNLRFYVEQPFTNVVSMITMKMAQYYTDREFSGVNVLEVGDETN